MGYRKDKLEELIKRVVSEIIMKELKDPRIGFITITRVELNRDYSEADIRFSVLGNPREIRKSLEGLKSSSGYIQHQLGKEIKLRHVPRIHFKLDSSVADGVRMVDLIENLDGVRDKSDDDDNNPEGES